MGLEWQKKLIDFQDNLFKGLTQTQNICKPTHSGIDYQGDSWKGASHMQEVGEVTGNVTSAGQTSRSQVAAWSPL